VSLISFGLITIERYLVICHDLKDHLTKTIIAIVLTNIYSMVNGFITISSLDHVDITGYVVCHPKFCSQTVPMLIKTLSSICVLLLFMFSVVYCPYQILQLYNGNSTSAGDSILAAENKREDMERKIRQRKVFFKLSIVTGFFIVMLGPMSIAGIYEIITGNATPPILAGFYATLLACNCAANPFLLYTFDISVKTRINQLFGFSGKPRVLSTPREKNALQSPLKLVGNKSFNVTDTKSFGVKDTVKINN
jgi:hypothetical protein